ncbi:uncharacterized protein LOC114742268 [Neltuma alba]|uniref:uncharacterized protein LOC114742268 n=1 Tax=Neltuma alba TaxID=207710 RepID=UPI0010A5283E|nr:uncharacterized protein LOC114742268 [Prosopis alba]
MSTMASHLGTRTGEPETEGDARNEMPKKEGEEDGDIGVEEGGILNNIISNLFHQNGDEQGKKMEDDDEEKNKQLKTEEDTNGGVIENIVSHLPPSIPDDAVPTADEAAILINSLVRD